MKDFEQNHVKHMATLRIKHHQLVEKKTEQQSSVFLFLYFKNNNYYNY